MTKSKIWQEWEQAKIQWICSCRFCKLADYFGRHFEILLIPVIKRIFIPIENCIIVIQFSSCVFKICNFILKKKLKFRLNLVSHFNRDTHVWLTQIWLGLDYAKPSTLIVIIIYTSHGIQMSQTLQSDCQEEIIYSILPINGTSIIIKLYMISPP